MRTFGTSFIWATHGYRFPNTSFDDCCANRKNRRTYLEACNNILKKDDIECVEVIRGSAIIITKSANPDHKNIICDKFAKIKNLNKHSTEKGYHMSGNCTFFFTKKKVESSYLINLHMCCFSQLKRFLYQMASNCG